MDVLYILFVIEAHQGRNFLICEYHRRRNRLHEVLDHIATDVFLIAKMDMPPAWTFPLHKAGSWYDEHLEYSNRLN